MFLFILTSRHLTFQFFPYTTLFRAERRAAEQEARRAEQAAEQAAVAACTLALQTLITERLGRRRGGRSKEQQIMRQKIIDGIRASLQTPYKNIDIDVTVVEGSGLFIKFRYKRSATPFSPFHVSIHDQHYQRSPQIYANSMAHSTSNDQNPLVLRERQSLLRLNCNNTQNDGREEIQFVLEVVNWLQAGNNAETMGIVNATIHGLNNLFRAPMYNVDGSWTGTLPFAATAEDNSDYETLFPGLKGGRTLKYKKIKNIKRKSIKINKSSKKRKTQKTKKRRKKKVLVKPAREIK